MEQLLKITTTPMDASLEIKNAQLKYSSEKVSPQYNRSDAKINISTKNTSVKLDSFEARKSMGIVSAKGLMYNMADAGRQAISELTGRYAMEGNRMAKAFKGETIPDIVMSRINPNFSMELKLLPSSPLEIDWEAPQANFEYVPGNLNINWDTNRREMEYIPGSVKMVINQYPKVNIEYVGRPNYVPPSSDPEYEGKD